MPNMGGDMRHPELPYTVNWWYTLINWCDDLGKLAIFIKTEHRPTL